MNFGGYKVFQKQDKIVIEDVVNFNLTHIFECGQAFRWKREQDESYTVIAMNKVINLRHNNTTLEIFNSSLEDFKNIWYKYFDLGTNYAQIKSKLATDQILRKAMEHGFGIRILNQDFWETLISFIISANNGIPRIMKTVEAIAQIYGEEITYKDKAYYTFPKINKLADSSVEKLWECKGGFRCKYIVSTANLLNSDQMRITGLKEIETDNAREYLMNFQGVGPKVADCVLLYSGTKQDVFPTDVWVKRVMEELYFKREASFKEINDFAKERFGDLAGYAQQYLFYYARENKIGVSKKA